MSTQILSAFAAFGLIGAGVAGASQTRAIDALPVTVAMAGAGQAAASGKCRVDVVRTGTPGTADVTRAVADNGGCICVVTTGPVAANGTAEEIVKAFLRDRTCDAAPPASPTGQTAAAAASGGGTGPIIPVVLGALGAAGLAAAAGGGGDGSPSNDSRG